MALSSGIFLTAGYITQMVSYLYTTPAKTAFLENVSVIIIPILLYICVKEKPTWLKVAACVLCFIGSGIIALKGGAEDFWSHQNPQQSYQPCYQVDQSLQSQESSDPCQCQSYNQYL